MHRHIDADKINKFFVGKLAELRTDLNDIVQKRRNVYRTHHTGGDTSDLQTLRDIYVDLAALRGYCDLNHTGAARYACSTDS